MRLLMIFLAASITLSSPLHGKSCQGKVLNPIKDVCWSCLFPLTIGGAKVHGSGRADTPNPKSPVCLCPGRLVPGVTVGFWEPIAVVDVVRTPFCITSLGGLQMGKAPHRQGGHSHGNGAGSHASYHVHWMKYPVFWVLQLFTDFLCLQQGEWDVGYVSEIDPMWNDEALGAVLSPEAALFATPPAQLACAADCLKASASLPIDKLFWCGGCQGSLYPFSGSNPAHVGGVQSSLLVTMKMMAKLHRQMLLPKTSGTTPKEICQKENLTGVIPKSQYRLQMSYPRMSTTCNPIGASEVVWGSGREFPYKGEDFSYIIWRKRNCCML